MFASWNKNMAQIKPFKALRPHIEYAAQVASKPYDVLNSEEAKNIVQFFYVFAG